ncbi:aldo/keto reductase [Chryseobacterium lacus]|uniref:aldo/keto reductase n=1 Tax=Chryseobacterium lacus TaxID=2058346 RepID=UPI000F87CCB7|nr:aldo/keto reductase [Chryseobacterium lacus]RST29109.1 aldo/keto reductase [Chryseobacterium lacus]
MKTIQLNNGVTIPAIGYGTYKTAENDVSIILSAIECGYRLLDTASIYKTEQQTGAAIRQSGIPREEITVISKVWRNDLGYHKTKEAFAKSLKQTGLNYLDLYLIHWPANARNFNNWQKTNAETWRAMEELLEEGKIKSIGVSNFWPEHLEALLDSAKIKPAVNQIEFHPGYWQPETTQYCKEKGIVLQAWSPLARGRIFGNEILIEIANRHQKTVSQIALRWIVQQGVIPIPKAASKERMNENFDIFDFALSDEEMELINNLPETGFSGERPDLWPERISKS